MLDEVDSVFAAVTVTVAVFASFPAPPTVRVPVVETPVVMVAETPGIIGIVMEVPVDVVTVDVVPVGGRETTLVYEAPVAAPLSVPAVPGLGLLLWAWAWFGNCQIRDSAEPRLRAKRRFLIFNMMIL